MRIAILHYHLRKGGVTRVMESQVEALSSLGHEVRLVAGYGDSELPHTIVPELDYLKKSALAGTSLLTQILATLPWTPELWIIHNPSLGKNVLLPRLLSALAEMEIPLLLQYHDFAEDGRPGNYELIAQQDVYPIADHIHHAFINSRDLGLLKQAGLPDEHCHCLPNAVNPEPIKKKTRQDHPLVLYPVRGIRRKNLGELCLLAKHAPSGTRFALTLPPENPQWFPIHDHWEMLAEELELPIIFRAVTAERDYHWWLSQSTHAITTSVAEGFGLSFLEPAFQGTPLIGRDLPDITCDFGSPTGTLYQKIPVSKDHLDLNELRHQLTTVYAAYGRVASDEHIRQATETMISEDQVDFGNLPEAEQEKIIKGPEIPTLKDWLTSALNITEPLKTNAENWSQKRYTQQLDTLINQVSTSTPSPVTWLDKERVLDQFLSPNRFHFLRT